MNARFIGADGSMGLVHGRVYNIQIWSDRDCIYVGWGKRFFPYSNLQKLQENWTLANDEKDAENRNTLGDILKNLVLQGFEIYFHGDDEPRHDITINLCKEADGQRFSTSRKFSTSYILDLRAGKPVDFTFSNILSEGSKELNFYVEKNRKVKPIKQFMDFNYEPIVFDITGVNRDKLFGQLGDEYINHLYELNGANFIAIWNCDLHGFERLELAYVDAPCRSFKLAKLIEDKEGFTYEIIKGNIPNNY